MFKRSLTLTLFLLSFSFYGQNANTSTSSKAIKANFSMASIQAYQESAILKIEDYYNYLTLLSNPSTSEALKAEVRTALFSILKRNDLKVLDFTSAKENLIPLIELIEKIENKNYHFSISNSTNTFLSNDSWKTDYHLEIRQNRDKKIWKCTQKVYFTTAMKQFGSTEKEVWTILLGEIE